MLMAGVVVSAHANCIEVFFFGVGRVATGGPFPTALTRTDPTVHIIKALSPLHALANQLSYFR